MNSKADGAGRFDKAKWVLVALLVVVGVAGNIYFGEQSLLYRVLALVALGVLAAYVALQTAQGAAFARLARESRIEIRKVVWPTRQETTQTTMIVVVFVLVSALILWGLDTLLGWLASLIIGLR